MKKLAAFIAILIVLVAIYNDITLGTLPAASEQKTETDNQMTISETAEDEIPYFEHAVKPGDTMLSVLDSKAKLPLDIPIAKAIADFKELNDGVEPQKIKFGKTYKFPDYSGLD